MNILKMVAAGVTFFLSAAAAQAQAWPTKTLTWIVPFAAGGPTDALARDVADKVGKQIGQAIIIENVGGAGGTLGAGKAAKATADGYTFLVGHLGYMGAAPSVYKSSAMTPSRTSIRCSASRTRRWCCWYPNPRHIKVRPI
jgi:tripartite-type tricarboxylate transporter receptor subunit TctC